MSINLGNEGCAAAHSLASSKDFAVIRAALREQAQMMANRALDAQPDLQAAACGYARAVRDIYVAIESAVTGTPQNQVKKPGVRE